MDMTRILRKICEILANFPVYCKRFYVWEVIIKPTNDIYIFFLSVEELSIPSLRGFWTHISPTPVGSQVAICSESFGALRFCLIAIRRVCLSRFRFPVSFIGGYRRDARFGWRLRFGSESARSRFWVSWAEEAFILIAEFWGKPSCFGEKERGTRVMGSRTAVHLVARSVFSSSAMQVSD